MVTKQIKIDSIDQNENSRTVYKRNDLAELIDSMKHHGQLQPIRVIDTKDGRYDIVFGNRRLVAARKLDWTEIEAQIVTQEDVDENERDIINLIENCKRQNTTPAEDGRIYQVLLDRGLTVEEIGARVGVTLERVRLGLEINSYLPEDLQKKVVNRLTGGSKPRGSISATATTKILSLRKTAGLNRKQVRSLMNYASEHDTCTQHFDQIAPLMKKGMDVDTAIKTVGKLRRVTINFFMDEKAAIRMEQKYKATIGEVVVSRLEKWEELKIKRFSHSGNRPRMARDLRDIG